MFTYASFHGSRGLDQPIGHTVTEVRHEALVVTLPRSPPSAQEPSTSASLVVAPPNRKRDRVGQHPCFTRLSSLDLVRPRRFKLYSLGCFAHHVSLLQLTLCLGLTDQGQDRPDNRTSYLLRNGSVGLENGFADVVIAEFELD